MSTMTYWNRRLAVLTGVRNYFLAICLFLAAIAPALATGLDDGDVIDSVFLNPRTGQPALVMSVDKPLDSPERERQLDYKLGTYVGFARSGDLYKRYPKADSTQRVLIAFILENQPSDRVRAMLFQAKGRLVDMGFDVWLRVFDEHKQKNVDLEP